MTRPLDDPWRKTIGLLLLFLVPSISVAIGCYRKPASSGHKGESPAKVEKLPQETEIARITLTEQAEQRLGITRVPIAKEKVDRRRTLGGEVIVPPGKAIVVSAPVPGTIAPTNGALPLPGSHVATGDPLLTIVPLLSPERDVPTPAERVQMANARATLLAAQTVAAGDVDRSRAEVEAAQITLQRAEKLLEDRAGSAQAVDDARAQKNIAESMLHAAEDRYRQLAQLVQQLDAVDADGNAQPLNLTAPQDGVVRSLAVSPGQTVTAGTALLEVVNTTAMWIRVPVYVDLLPEIVIDAPAQVVGLGGRRGSDATAEIADRTSPPVRLAQPIAAPPSADPTSTTVDLFFEIDNAGGELRPGQRVGVELALRGESEALIVPARAILYDIYGGTWVYVQTGERAYQRSRVLVQYTLDDRAVLAAGPDAGTEVVVDGAAELFGTEFGTGK